MIARRVLTCVSVAVVALATAACTVPSDNEARPIDPARLGSAESNKINCTTRSVGAQTETVQAYLVSQSDEPPFVTPVDRIITKLPPTPYSAVDALINCRVTDDESRRGLATLLPQGTQLIGLDPVPDQPGMYEVRLGALPNRGTQKVDDLDKLAVAQMFFTATGPGLTEQVRGLRFTIAGRAVAVNTDRVTVGQNDFVKREDFLRSSPPSATTPTTTTAIPAVSTTRP